MHVDFIVSTVLGAQFRKGLRFFCADNQAVVYLYLLKYVKIFGGIVFMLIFVPIKQTKTITMKAIITNVKKSSGFAYLNGHTFEVKEILHDLVALSIPSKIIYGKFDTCDFLFAEVTIVDIDNEMQQAYDDYNWGNDNKTYSRLKNYCAYKSIKTNEKIQTIA